MPLFYSLHKCQMIMQQRRVDINILLWKKKKKKKRERRDSKKKVNKLNLL